MTCSGLPFGFCTPSCGCRTAAAELRLPNRYRRNPLPWLRVAEPLPHPAAVASSRRTAAAELRLLHGYQRSVAAATYHRTYHRTYRRTPNCC